MPGSALHGWGRVIFNDMDRNDHDITFLISIIITCGIILVVGVVIALMIWAISGI